MCVSAVAEGHVEAVGSAVAEDEMERHGRNKVYGAVVKGSLADRIEKLGLEAEPNTMTSLQLSVKQIAEELQYTDSQLIQSNVTKKGMLGRPKWAGGAFLYMDKRTAGALHLLQTLYTDGEIPHGVGTLASKYLFCDRAHWPLLRTVLKETPALGINKRNPAPKGSKRQKYIATRANPATIFDMDLPNFITLNEDVWELNGLLDEDTCEYLTAPVSVQKLNPDTWDEIYELLQISLPDEIKAITHPDTGVMAPHCARCGNPLWFRPCGCHDNLPCTTDCEKVSCDLQNGSGRTRVCDHMAGSIGITLASKAVCFA